jgi:hypothetical protein
MINKSCDYELRKAYFEAISGITYANKTIGVYDEIAPEGAEYPLIILGTQSSNLSRSKDTFQRDALIEVSVLTTYTSDFGGKKVANDISNIIIGRIIKSNSSFGIDGLMPSWQVINCDCQTNTLTSQLPTGWQVEQLNIFTQLLNQLN